MISLILGINKKKKRVQMNLFTKQKKLRDGHKKTKQTNRQKLWLPGDKRKEREIWRSGSTYTHYYI